MRAKITAYNNNSGTVSGCSDFGLSCYWGNDYKNVFYVCGDLGRSTFEDIIETETDITGQTERIQNTSIERFNISVLAISPLLQFLKTIDKHDVKTIEFLDTGDVYNIKNIDIDDQGETLTPTNLVYITFEDEPISQITPAVYELDSQKLAFWDNNDDGTADINGEAQYTSGTTYLFNTWQLYYEADGITPATSGEILFFVYAVTQTEVNNLIGVFRGQFGDFFSDSTKWQSTQNIWNYFNVADTVGHTNRVQFDKEAFAKDNGYFSDELEDRAVNIRFDLSIDGSDQQSTTLSLVYTVWGAFMLAGVQSALTNEYGYTTIGKGLPNLEKNTLATVADVSTPFGGLSDLVTSFVLTSQTLFTNTYVLATTPAGETAYTGVATTNGGYENNNYRGSIGSDEFNIGLNPNFNILQDLNILNNTLGTAANLISLRWIYNRAAVTWANLGDITAAGAAECLLNGVLVNTLPTIAPATVQVLGLQNITLPDTEKNIIKFTLPTTTGAFIYNEFEVQLKPLY
jgi:hypothetical protein